MTALKALKLKLFKLDKCYCVGIVMIMFNNQYSTKTQCIARPEVELEPDYSSDAVDFEDYQ